MPLSKHSMILIRFIWQLSINPAVGSSGLILQLWNTGLGQLISFEAFSRTFYWLTIQYIFRDEKLLYTLHFLSLYIYIWQGVAGVSIIPLSIWCLSYHPSCKSSFSSVDTILLQLTVWIFDFCLCIDFFIESSLMVSKDSRLSSGNP